MSQNKFRGFTLVEIMIVVAILGLLIALGIPGFLTARNKTRTNAEMANLKAISDNISSYGVNETRRLDSIVRLWPSNSLVVDTASYICKQLFCPVTKVGYTVNTSQNLGQCLDHGTEHDLNF